MYLLVFVGEGESLYGGLYRPSADASQSILQL